MTTLTEFLDSERKEFESFDSFFAGLSMKDEKNAIKLYEKYYQDFLSSHDTRLLAFVREMIRTLIQEHDEMNKRLGKQTDKMDGITALAILDHRLKSTTPPTKVTDTK